MALSSDQTSGAADAPEIPRRPRRLVQRASFVVVLMGLGALVAALISAAMAVRYDATAIVGLPERLQAAQLLGAADQTNFSGSDGESLEVRAEIGAIRFVGSSDDAEAAARTANTAATAFVASVSEDGVVVSDAASAPSAPASPRRVFNLAIGIGIGAMLGLILQAALRPPRVDESVTFVPTWTTLEDTPDLLDVPDGPLPTDVAEQAAPPAGSAAAQSLPAGRPRPRSFQEAASDASDPIWADAELADDELAYEDLADDELAYDELVSQIAIPGADTSPAPGPGAVWHDADQPDAEDLSEDDAISNDASTDDSSASDEIADGSPLAELDIPDPPLTVGRGFRDLIDRTSANLDPMIDRFEGDDDAFDEDLESLRTATTQLAASAGEDNELVGQIAFLSDELATHRQRMQEERSRHREERDELIADHEVELEDLRGELELAQADTERVRERRDSARSQLEDQVTELETALAASADEVERARRTSDATGNRRTLANEDVEAEIEFLRTEIERYQRTLDEERVTHATAVAGARLENEAELDRIHREHRVTLNQLAQTNSNLLNTQRNEADTIMADLEVDHQRALDAAHKDYEQRLSDARAHYAEQLATLEQRALTDLQEEQATELEELHERLDVALLDARTARQRTTQLEAEIASSDRRVEQAQLLHSQTERRLHEELRQIERRNDDLTERLATTEHRLADERRRTNEVVRNLLRESASTASDAASARRNNIEFREELEAEQAKEITELNERLRALEETAAQRETMLEATIAGLRDRLGASPNP